MPVKRSARRAQSAAPGSGLASPDVPAGNRWLYSFMAEPHPAELTTTTSTPASSNVVIVCRANRAASAPRPLCSDRAPQQPWWRGMTTSQPSAASTRTVASLTPGKNTCCTHPVSRPTTARRDPCAGTRRARAVRCPRGGEGATRSDATSSGANRAASRLPSIRRITPVRWAARSGRVSIRSRAGYGNVAKIAARAARSRGERGGSGEGGGPPGGSSAQPRAASMSRSYCTPEGQAGTQAMQPRQRSRWVAAASLAIVPPASVSPATVSPAAAPSRIWVIRWIRPRGESISSPHSW